MTKKKKQMKSLQSNDDLLANGLKRSVMMLRSCSIRLVLLSSVLARALILHTLSASVVYYTIPCRKSKPLVLILLLDQGR